MDQIFSEGPYLDLVLMLMTQAHFLKYQKYQDEMEQLNKASVHNLTKERSVGSTNNEINIRGKQNLESVSRKLILNKSFDLIENNPEHFNKFRKPAQEIYSLKSGWKAKMKGMEEAFSNKENKFAY